MDFQKSNSLYATCQIISAAIDKNELNLALGLIHDFVEHIITEPLCTGHVNGSRELDDLCQKIGEYNFSRMTEYDIKKPIQEKSRSTIVYIVTKIQNSGGHSAVLETFIAARPDVNHVILSTELNGKSDADSRLCHMANLNDIVFEPSPKGNFQYRLSWLQKRLIDIQPEQTYLFNNHQDSVAVAAIQPSMALNASFYHHADHHLCLGVFLPHLREHIDIHPMGYYHCRSSLGIDNKYLPLTVNDKGMRTAETSFKINGYLTTCTAARANKIESPYFISYLHLIPQLLKATGGKHIHIGRLTPWALFKLRRGLKSSGVSSDKFVYVPWVPSVWEALLDYNVDLYVASFPYGGGLTLIEAMGAGVPVVIHRHIYSRVLSGIDLAYPSAFSWQNPDDLIFYCSKVTADSLIKSGNIARKYYEKHYHRNIFNTIINKKVEFPVPNMLSDYTKKNDEWACWMAHQLSIKNLVIRTAYRCFRQLRRML